VNRVVFIGLLNIRFFPFLTVRIFGGVRNWLQPNLHTGIDDPSFAQIRIAKPGKQDYEKIPVLKRGRKITLGNKKEISK